MSSNPGLDGALGITHREVTADRVVLEFTIGDQHLQPYGIVHGGTYCAAHESAASVAGQVWLGEKGIIVGTNNSCDFLKSAKPGDTLTTTATPIHRGRSQQLWRVETRDQNDLLVAQGQVRLANLDKPLPPGAADMFKPVMSEDANRE